MALDFRFGAIVTVASLFLVVPSAPGEAVSRAPETSVEPVPSLSIASLSFRTPEIRTITLAEVDVRSWQFQQTLMPVAVFDGAETPATSLTGGQQSPGRPEAPNNGLSSVLAAIGKLQSDAAVAPRPEPLEEFPGAVAVAVPRVAANTKWRRIIDEGRSAVADCAETTSEQCAATPSGRWHALVQKASALEGEARLQAVNEGVNALLTYASDDETYGIGDYWATLQESLARGRGDCEDIAIAKMWLLNAAGVDLSDMRLVVLNDTLRGIDHAVLSVIEDGHQYVLDNTAWKVGRADWMRGYRPIYALSSQQSWIYGSRVPVQVAQSTAQAISQ